jgi:hypothetical protein
MNQNFKDEVRAWISTKAGFPVADGTQIFTERALRSVHVPELILLMERLRGEPIDVEDLKPADFRDIDTLVVKFGPPVPERGA